MDGNFRHNSRSTKRRDALDMSMFGDAGYFANAQDLVIHLAKKSPERAQVSSPCKGR